MRDSVYHKLLRISALSLSLALLFVSGVLSPITRELSKDTGSYLANAIGMQASVVTTEINTLSAQLLERDKEITAREIAVNLKESQQTGELSTFILSVLLFVLLVLIILNYALDFVRTKKLITLTTKNEQVA